MSHIEENTTAATTTTTNPEETRYTGQIKWFDRSKGYGFITELKDNRDIFVHFSQISGKQDDFRYLIAGEYVEFGISEIKSNTASEEMKQVATHITGICAGKLMYETILDQQQNLSEYHYSGDVSEKQPSPVKKFGFQSKHKGRKPR